MTGTPIQNSEKDLVSLCKLMGIWDEIRENPEDVVKILKPYVMMRSKKDVGLKLAPYEEEIIKIIEKIHSQLIIDTSRIDFHIAVPVQITNSSLRLNFLHSSGKRILGVNQNSFMVDFNKSTAWLTQRQVANIFGIPRSTMSNICKRWKL